jgi:tRNA modification GTPase
LADTIFAQATPDGRSGIAVIRVSGPRSRYVLESLCEARPLPRVATLSWMREPATGERLDEGLVLWFPAPRSFTGEDSVEFQLHGSRAVCRSVLRVLGAQQGVRPAEPGEFTRRALLNGRLDLARTEGLGDLLMAETEAQRRQALRLMEGRLSQVAAEWREQLIRALAYVEASIDFADEELPEGLAEASLPAVDEVAAGMRAELAGFAVSERLRDGFEVALVGPPNVGKSTLLNHLAGREAALISPLPGTTRDVLEIRMDLGGLPVIFLDMAGLREAEDSVEAMGVARARSRAEAADLRVFLCGSGDRPEELGVARRPEDPVVRAKADLDPERPGLAVSGLTGAGVDRMLAAVKAVLAEKASGAGLVSHQRQRSAVERALLALEGAAARLRRGGEPEMVAADLHAAVRALELLAGKSDIEAVLDVIFQSFCLGK